MELGRAQIEWARGRLEEAAQLLDRVEELFTLHPVSIHRRAAYMDQRLRLLLDLHLPDQALKLLTDRADWLDHEAWMQSRLLRLLEHRARASLGQCSTLEAVETIVRESEAQGMVLLELEAKLSLAEIFAHCGQPERKAALLGEVEKEAQTRHLQLLTSWARRLSS